MLNFIILDDDESHNLYTKERLKLIFERNRINGEIWLVASDPRAVIEYAETAHSGNSVYLLDVDVNSNISGLDIAMHIRETDMRSYIVFMSAYPEYVMPSLKTKVFDYLLKPVPVEDLERCIVAIDKDNRVINPESFQPLTIRSGFIIHNIKPEEIVFLEKYGHVLVIHTVNGRIESQDTLENMENKLDSNRFYRCHKSFIVNLSFISNVDYLNNIIRMKNDETCLVSKRCKRELKSICN
jgi:DNA-binding LytR/AlgR family response regulator